MCGVCGVLRQLCVPFALVQFVTRPFPPSVHQDHSGACATGTQTMACVRDRWPAAPLYDSCPAHTHRCGWLGFDPLRSVGDCCAPPDLVRDQVKSRSVLVALLLATLFMAARLSLGSQYFVLPQTLQGPKDVRVEALRLLNHAVSVSCSLTFFVCIHPACCLRRSRCAAR